MRGQTVARNYAEALFELSQKHDGPELFGESLEMVARLLEEEPQVRIFLETPAVEASKKKTVLRSVFQERVPRPFLNFLLLTVDKRRQHLFREMARQYMGLLDEHLNRAHVEVTVARPLDDEGQALVTRELSRVLGKSVIAQVRVKPEILGGLLVRYGDTIFDGSVRRQMERLRRKLMTTELPVSGGA